MQQLSVEDFRKIVARRDRRFDGRIYVGVRTTQIYCRPVCPARPKPENIVMFKSPSAAEKVGYRPCRRCRPDLAPGSRLFEGTGSTVARALRLIQSAGDDALAVTSLAATLGVTDRHLRRLFNEHLGASPIEIMISKRLDFANLLIQDTELPLTEVALASGFKSIRRFNEAFKARHRASPSQFRESKTGRRGPNIDLKIRVRVPYDWQATIAYLARHETYGVEAVRDGVYHRFVKRGQGFGLITVARQAKQDSLAVRFTNLPVAAVRPGLMCIKRLFDTDHNPSHLPIAPGFVANGIRVPGCFEPFETAVSVILSQLVSTEQARRKLKNLVERFGERLGTSEFGAVYAFPKPQVLAGAEVELIGVPRVRAQAIRSLAAMTAAGALDLHSYADFPTATAQLLAIKGIGPWTAAMIAMRCLGDPDAFPAGDLIVKRALEQKIADAALWSSSRAYLTHCLWRDFSNVLSKTKGVRS